MTHHIHVIEWRQIGRTIHTSPSAIFKYVGPVPRKGETICDGDSGENDFLVESVSYVIQPSRGVEIVVYASDSIGSTKRDWHSSIPETTP